MNIIQLQYLIDVGELGSFTDAAKKNHMTVPTISQSIGQLEAELDVQLFSRSRKGTIPTAEGKKVIQYASTIIKTVEKMKKEISLTKNENQGNIAIASIPGMVPQVINTTLEIRKSYPFVNIQMIEGDTVSVLNNVKNGHADMGFLSATEDNHDESLIWEPVVKGEFILVTSKNSSLRFNDNIVGPELEDELIVLYNDPNLHKITHELLEENSSNKIALSTNNLDALFQMVINGNAVTIGPNYILNTLPSHIRDEITTVTIEKYKTLPIYLWRVRRKNEKLTKIIEQFTDQLLSYFKS